MGPRAMNVMSTTAQMAPDRPTLAQYGIPEGSRLKRRSIPILCALGGLCVQSVPSPIDFPEHHVQ